VELLDAPSERSSESSTAVDGVAVVRWPDEQTRADELARRAAPRLLLVAVGAEAPADTDPLCDWVQEPADELDVQSRIVELRARASIDRPILGDHGVVWRGSVWVALSPIEARLTAAFDSDLVDWFRLTGEGWHGRINQVLRVFMLAVQCVMLVLMLDSPHVSAMLDGNVKDEVVRERLRDQVTRFVEKLVGFE